MTIDLGRDDLVIALFDDPGFMGLFDVGSYAKDLPDWDLGTLAARVCDEMAAGHAVAWGHPEAKLTVRVTTRPIDVPDASARFDATLVSTGQVCLSGYTSITMAAQFAKHTLPQPDDTAATLAPGRYAVTVWRRFAHTPGRQDPDGALPAGDHVIVRLTRDDGATAARPAQVPWTPWP